MDRCKALTKNGQPCRGYVVEGDYCRVHRPGGIEALREAGRKGGAALRQKMTTPGFNPDRLGKLVTLENAKTALDAIRCAVLRREITHHEGNTATRAVEAWVRAEGANQTDRLINELKVEVEKKKEEIDALRKQMMAGGGLRVAR